MVILLLLAVFADVVAPHSPIQQFRDHFLTPPIWQQGGSSAFPLGTDDVGRDVLARLIYGARLSLLIGIAVVTLSLVLRHRAGSYRRLRRRIGGHRDHAVDGHRAGVPEPAAGHRDRRHPRPRPVQRHDRGRRRDAAQLHASHPRRGAVRAGARLRHRDALRRRRQAAPDVQHRAAELPGAVDRAGHTGLRHCDPGRGGAGLPRPGRAAADAGMGHHAGRRAAVLSARLVGAGVSRAWRSCSPCWRSTCSAMGCATRWIPG